MPLPIRSMKRAATSQPTVGARGKIGFVNAARPYPKAARTFLLPSQSLRAPEKILVIEAVASAMPSMIPTVSVEAPSTVTK